MKKIHEVWKKINKTHLVIGVVFLLLVFNTFGFVVFVTQNKNELVLNPYVQKILPLYRSLREIYKTGINILYIPHMIGRVEMPHYELRIDPKDIAKLNATLPRSVSYEVLTGREWLGNENKETVPAVFIYDGTEYAVQVRYRGDSANHWTRKKRSWQVKFNNDHLFRGIKTLKLILPGDRHYFVEDLNNYRAEKFGLAVPDTDYVRLKINGSDSGVYYQVEDWSRQMLEKDQFPADVNIYTTNDVTLIPVEGASGFENQWYWDKQTEDAIFPYSNFAEIDTLIQLIAEKRYEELSRLVDLDNFYKWNVIAMLAGSTHQSDRGNVRLYFNTSKGKFQLIPWDVNVSSAVDPVAHKLSAALLRDPSRMRAQKKVLWEYVSDDAHLADDLNFYDEKYFAYRKSFYRDFVKHDSNRTFDARVASDRALFKENFEKIRRWFLEDNSRLTIGYDGSRQEVSLRFDVDNFGGLMMSSLSIPVPLFARGTLAYDTNANGIFDDVDKVLETRNSEDGRILFHEIARPMFNALRGSHAPHTFFVALNFFGAPHAGISIEGIRAALENATTGEEVTMENIRLSDTTTFRYLADISRTPEEFVRSHPIFFVRDGDIILPSGGYRIAETIVIPQDTSLTIRPGSTLYFAPDTSLISYSPIKAEGTAGAPITFRGVDAARPWGVVGIVDTDEENIFTNVRFQNGGGAFVNGALFTGMLSAYHSPLRLEESTIEGAQDDDGVNVKYASAMITRTRFVNNSADGIDLDFAEGEIAENVFEKNKDDAIDISGSSVFIRDNFITDSGDKGISIGEKSLDPIIFNNVIRNSKIGIETKDGSTPVILHTVIVNNGVGINAYRKKAIFGTGGKPHLYNSIVWGNTVQVSEDEFSDVDIDRSAVEGDYKGNKNFDEEPVFQNPDAGDYTLVTTDGKWMNGDTDIIKTVFGSAVDAAPVGLFVFEDVLKERE